MPKGLVKVYERYLYGQFTGILKYMESIMKLYSL